MRYFGIYTNEGRISQTGKTSRNVVEFPIGTNFVESDKMINPETQYVHIITKALLSRPENTAKLNKSHIFDNGIDKAIISNIPFGSKIIMSSIKSEKIEEICNDGIVEISSDFSDYFDIQIKSHPEKDVQFKVVAE